jgi:hypothetical protein
MGFLKTNLEEVSEDGSSDSDMCDNHQDTSTYPVVVSIGAELDKVNQLGNSRWGKKLTNFYLWQRRV